MPDIDLATLLQIYRCEFSMVFSEVVKTHSQTTVWFAAIDFAYNNSTISFTVEYIYSLYERPQAALAMSCKASD